MRRYSFLILLLASSSLIAATASLQPASATTIKAKRTPRAEGSPVFRGVNLGGFLVLESWITPSLFSNYSVADGLGEWQFCAQLGPTVAAQALTQHWNTWVLQSDIQAIAASGITHLRIPVGYWIVDIQPGEPWVAGGWNYLVRVLQWAKLAGLVAIVDLHGAPGSQNGFDNSGYAGPINWPEPQNVNRTLYDLGLLAKQIVALNQQPATLNVVIGIEILNEPLSTAAGGPIELPFLLAFYENAYTVIRNQGFNGDIWIHDGFAYTDPIWDNFMPQPYYDNVYLDTHIYHCFGGPRQASTPWGNIQYTCQNDLPMIAQHVWSDWTIVGEWSLATGPATPLGLVDGKGWLASFAHAQIEAYCPQCVSDSSLQAGQGYFFWHFKMETGYDEWNYLEGVAQGWFPSNASVYNDAFAFSCADFYSIPPPSPSAGGAHTQSRRPKRKSHN